MHRIIDAELRVGTYDLIVVESIWLCSYWPALRRTGIPIVLQMYDVVSEFLARQARISPLPLDRTLLLLDARRMRHLEARLCREAALTVVTSTRDAARLEEHVEGARIAVAPNGVDVGTIAFSARPDGNRLLFIGAFDYAPNVDAVEFFADRVLPELQRIVPDAVFVVAGRKPPSSLVRKMKNFAGVEWLGEVDSVAPLYARSAVSVVPVRAGGGTRLKIAEAMAYGRPVVSTAQGAEGFEAIPGRHYLLADDPLDMAKAVATLLNDRERYARIAKEGRSLVESRYSWTRICDDLYKEYTRVAGEKKMEV